MMAATTPSLGRLLKACKYGKCSGTLAYSSNLIASIELMPDSGHVATYLGLLWYGALND